MATELNGPGCTVTILGRSGLQYREGDRTIAMDGEMLVGQFDFVIYQGSMRALEHPSESLSEGEKQRIVANIKAAFRQNNMAIDVQT